MKLAVYGTLKQGYGNNVLLKDCQFLGRGTITGYRMYQSGIPYVVLDPSNDRYKVHVEVYDCPKHVVTGSVDRLEGHPEWYCRTPCVVTMEDGTEVPAEVYLVPSCTGTEVLSGNFSR